MFLFTRHWPGLLGRLLLPLLCSLALLPCVPAHAGHWVVTLTGTAAGSYKPNSSYTFQNSTIVSPSPDPYQGQVLQLMGGYSQASVGYVPLAPGSPAVPATMTVQATFTWTRDAPQDPSLPPSSVTVFESGTATVQNLDGGSGTQLMQANDGFLTPDGLSDPAGFNLYNTTYPFREMRVQSMGSYVTLNVPVPVGALSFTLPWRSLSVGIATATGPTGSPGGALAYKAGAVIAPDVIIQASPLTASAGGTATTTVTVKSVDGFAGTVAFSLTGLPSGLLPSKKPSGQLVAGGWTTVDPYAGGPGQVGPTDAQLAALVNGSFSPGSVTLTSGGSVTTNLTLSTASWAILGRYAIQIQGVATNANGSFTRNGLTTLTIH